MVSEKNQYLKRLKRVLTMHTGLVVLYTDLHRRVFAEQLFSYHYLPMLVSSLRGQGWKIKVYPGEGYKLIEKPE